MQKPLKSSREGRPEEEPPARVRKTAGVAGSARSGSGSVCGLC